MIKMLNNEALTYEVGNFNWEENKTVQLSGKLSVNKKNATNNSPYLLITIADETGKKTLTQVAFVTNPLYDFLKEYEKQKNIPFNADIKFIKSKQYESMEIHRIHIDVPSEEEIQEAKAMKEANDKSLSARVSEAIKSIKEPNLRRLCFSVYKDKSLIDKLFSVPATEHSAYNEKGGLLHMISDTINITNSMVTALNADFGDDSVKFNLDLMKAGAILCNVGRALIYEYDEEENIVKSEAGIIDNELFITRDIVMRELNAMRSNVDKDGKPLYDVDSDIIKELLHMLASSKNKLETSSAIVARTKHASLLSDIVSVVFTKGLFDNLEKTSNQKVVKAYDGGRAYVLYETAVNKETANEEQIDTPQEQSETQE